MLEEGDTIFINSSSTALKLINYIGDKRVIVITNNGKAIYEKQSSKVSVILTGGELREVKEAMVGDFALNNLDKVSAKKCFLGCSGLSVDSGMTTEILDEVKINQLMIRRVTGPTFIMADHTKIGRNSSFVSCNINRIKYVITDEKADKEVIEQFKALGIKVHQVSLDDEL